MSIIFDLDQTLVDSSVASQDRLNRNWDNVYRLIPSFHLYEGIIELLYSLQKNNIATCIVTSSPGAYCRRVISHFKIPISNTVCYHDTQRHKPHPEPMLLASKKLGVQSNEVIAVGDDPKDTIAANNAGMISIGVTWGSPDSQSLRASSPMHICETIDSLAQLLEELL